MWDGKENYGAYAPQLVVHIKQLVQLQSQIFMFVNIFAKSCEVGWKGKVKY